MLTYQRLPAPSLHYNDPVHPIRAHAVMPTSWAALAAKITLRLVPLVDSVRSTSPERLCAKTWRANDSCPP